MLRSRAVWHQPVANSAKTFGERKNTCKQRESQAEDRTPFARCAHPCAHALTVKPSRAANKPKTNLSSHGGTKFPSQRPQARHTVVRRGRFHLQADIIAEITDNSPLHASARPVRCPVGMEMMGPDAARPAGLNEGERQREHNRREHRDQTRPQPTTVTAARANNGTDSTMPPAKTRNVVSSAIPALTFPDNTRHKPMLGQFSSRKLTEIYRTRFRASPQYPLRSRACIMCFQ